MKLNTISWKALLLELFVVFLGITAGFVLNNWRENNADRKLELKYLKSFHRDVSENIISLHKTLKSDSIWLERTNNLLGEIVSKTLTLDSANVLTEQITNFRKTEMQTLTYKDIVNSGNLNLIQDFDTKNRIVDYYMKIEGVELIEDYSYGYFSNQVMPFFINKFSALDGTFIDDKIIESKKFANIAAICSSLKQQQYAAYSEILIESETLASELKTILDKNK